MDSPSPYSESTVRGGYAKIERNDYNVNNINGSNNEATFSKAYVDKLKVNIKNNLVNLINLATI